jgi:ubiquitin-protein ligase
MNEAQIEELEALSSIYFE